MSQSPDPPSRLRVVSLHDPAGILDRVRTRPDVIRPRFAPIADLRRGVMAGYEVVLSLGGDDVAAPRDWAREVHPQAAGRLESGLVEVALAERERLPAGAYIGINVSSAGLGSPELRRLLAQAGRLEHIVVMVTEDEHGTDAAGVAAALDGVRDAGGLIGVDETGSGYASLRRVLDLRPDFVRVGPEFVAGLDGDPAKAAVVEALAALAARTDAWVIASGIPGRPELSALRRMGIPLGQGPMFGPPATVMAELGDLPAEAIRQASPPVEAAQTVAALVEARPALPWGGSLEEVADAFLDDPMHDVIVLVDERSRPLALAERAALLRGEPYERPVMRITPTSPLKAAARRAAARPMLERFHPLVACDRRGVYLGIVRVEQLLGALAEE